MIPNDKALEKVHLTLQDQFSFRLGDTNASLDKGSEASKGFLRDHSKGLTITTLNQKGPAILELMGGTEVLSAHAELDDVAVSGAVVESLETLLPGRQSGAMLEDIEQYIGVWICNVAEVLLGNHFVDVSEGAICGF